GVFLLRLRRRRGGGGERHAVGQPVRQLFELLRRAAVFLRLGKRSLKLGGQLALLVAVPCRCPLIAQDLASEGEQLVAGDAAEIVADRRTPVTGHLRTGQRQRQLIGGRFLAGRELRLQAGGDAVRQQVQLLLVRQAGKRPEPLGFASRLQPCQRQRLRD